MYDWPTESRQAEREFPQLIQHLGLWYPDQNEAGFRNPSPSFQLECDTFVHSNEWEHLPGLLSGQPDGQICIFPQPWKHQPLVNSQWSQEFKDSSRPEFIWFGPHIEASAFASQQVNMQTYVKRALQLYHTPDNLMLPAADLLQPADIDILSEQVSKTMGNSSALLGLSRYGCLAFIIRLNSLLAAYKVSRSRPDAHLKLWDVGTMCYSKERQRVIICGLSGDESKPGCEFLQDMRQATCINEEATSMSWEFWSSSETAQVLTSSGVKKAGYSMWDTLGLALLYPKEECDSRFSLQLAPEVHITKAHPLRPPVDGTSHRPVYLQECPSTYDVHILLSRHGFDIEGDFRHDPSFADAMGHIANMIQAKPACPWE